MVSQADLKVRLYGLRKPPPRAGQQRPARIVSTAPSITEVLFALGLGGRVVGVSSYCRYPEQVTALPDVGSFLRPSTELIARLRPDLVIVNRASNDVARQLAALRLPAMAVDEARSLASIYAMVHEIGRGRRHRRSWRRAGRPAAGTTRPRPRQCRRTADSAKCWSSSAAAPAD